jgi:hypothetical protein
MKKIITLIQSNNLRIIDAIVLKKRFIGMVDHFVLFGGYDEHSEPIFVANYDKGVKIVPHSDMIEYLEVLAPERFMRFKGNDFERGQAIERAKSRIGEKAYDYFANNCEHFVTWVHTGKHTSKQVANAGVSLMAIGTVATAGGIAKKNDALTILGIGALLLGAILKFGLNDSEIKK